MMPRSLPPTAHFLPTSEGSRACSQETKKASASRWTMVGSAGMRLGVCPRAGGPELRLRLGGSSEFAESQAELIVDVGAGRVDPQRLAVLRDRLVQPPGARERQAVVGPRLGVAGPQAERLGDLDQG